MLNIASPLPLPPCEATEMQLHVPAGSGFVSPAKASAAFGAAGGGRGSACKQKAAQPCLRLPNFSPFCLRTKGTGRLRQAASRDQLFTGTRCGFLGTGWSIVFSSARRKPPSACRTGIPSSQLLCGQRKGKGPDQWGPSGSMKLPAHSPLSTASPIF